MEQQNEGTKKRINEGKGEKEEYKEERMERQKANEGWNTIKGVGERAKGDCRMDGKEAYG